MANFFKTAALGIAAAVIATTGALAQTSESVGAKRDWSIFKQGSADQRHCWIVTQPLTSTAKRGGQPVSVNRGDIFLMISIRPGGGAKNEVSFMSGYPFKKGGAVKLEIGSLRDCAVLRDREQTARDDRDQRRQTDPAVASRQRQRRRRRHHRPEANQE